MKNKPLFYGIPLSDWDIQNRRVSFLTLSYAVPCIAPDITFQELWKLDPEMYVENGSWFRDEDGEFCDEEAQGASEVQIYQYMFVDEERLDLLAKADQLVLRSDKLGVYVWCVEFIGTSWRSYGTSIELDEEGYMKDDE